MAIEIIQYPHPTLRHLSKPLKRVDKELRKIISEMFELMYEHEGVGLAANQVDLPYRFFVMNAEGDPDIKEAERVVINPVLSAGKGQDEDNEGCLSIPGLRGPVTRNTTLRLQAFDLAGNEVNETLEGFAARVVQHETDHLNGTLFIDRMSPTQKVDIRDALEEFELDFHSKQVSGDVPASDALARRLAELEKMRT